MHQGLKTLLIGSLLLAAPAAFAQGDDASGGGDGSATVGAGADANAGGAGASAGAGATVGTGGAATQEMGSRPYTLPKGGLVVYGDFDLTHLASTSGTTSTSFTQEGFHLGAGYGVDDKLTVGAEFSFPVAGDGTDTNGFKGPLRFYGMYGLAHTDKLEVAAEAHFEINLCGTISISATGGGCGTSEAIGAGLDARYVLAPKIALFTGSPYGPGVPGAVGAAVFPGISAGVGQHLNISFDSNTATTFDIPVGVALQATPQLFAYLEFDLARINIVNAPTGTDAVQVIFSDAHGIPTSIGGFYSVNKNLDVGLNILDDLKNAGDFYVLALAARFTK